MIKLNEEQLDFVNCEDDVLVTACPGSGKTRAICSKVIKLIENEDLNGHIAVLTFTNRAAEEVKERVNQLVEVPKKLWIGTIHSFCLEWITRSFRSEIEELRHGFTLADEFQASSIMDVFKKEEGIPYYESVNTKLNIKGQYLESNSVKLKILSKYHQELKKNKLIDYDFLIYICFKFLKEEPRACGFLAKLFNWVIIDEYQDTQVLQYEIMGLIAKQSPETKFAFVGDPDQAIYTTLGGYVLHKNELSNLLDRTFLEIKLNGCYRSSQKIIDYYSDIMGKRGQIVTKIDKELESVIKYNYSISKESLSDEIIKVIQNETSKGYKESDICIIAPKWDLVNPIARDIKAKAPHISIDSPGLSPISKNRDNVWFYFAKIFLTDSSPRNFRRRNMWAREAITELSNIIGREDLKEMTTLSFLEKANKSRSNKEDGFEYLQESFGTLIEVLTNKNMNDFPILKEKHDKFIEGSKKKVQDFNIINNTLVFKSFFEENEGVVINSCHGVKGEEYAVVIVFGLLEGMLPHWGIMFDNTIDTSREVAKLLYVIASRAKHKLYLFSETGRKTLKKKNYSRTPYVTLKYNYD
ncbi:MAG: ATP-dependent helicase [Bacteriovoracaceae bacterium]|jgi:superfamily I DNA/RNA helicase|nr:ATP-dependent helicase [Bacteriovoracaceae bacterium]